MRGETPLHSVCMPPSLQMPSNPVQSNLNTTTEWHGSSVASTSRVHRSSSSVGSHRSSDRLHKSKKTRSPSSFSSSTLRADAPSAPSSNPTLTLQFAPLFTSAVEPSHTAAPVVSLSPSKKGTSPVLSAQQQQRRYECLELVCFCSSGKLICSFLVAGTNPAENNFFVDII